MKHNIYRKYVKRILDIVLSLMAMPFFGILFIFIAPAIWMEDHGSVFYTAPRRSQYGKTFMMYKFRSMIMNAPDLRNKDNTTFNSPTDSRITKVGKVLRRTSLDEVPQILNILKGDMSIIGPRPNIPTPGLKYEDIPEKEKKRLEVKAGLTGYVQAYYRNSVSKDVKLEADSYYVDNCSFWLDCKIFFKTISTVLTSKGVYEKPTGDKLRAPKTADEIIREGKKHHE